MDKVQVSRAVASLKRRDRVARTGDTKDGRVTRLSLTPKGRAIYDEILPLALRREKPLLSALSPAERQSFDRLLTKLARQAKLLGAPRLRAIGGARGAPLGRGRANWHLSA